MKTPLFIALSLTAISAHAFPNPQYIPLGNTVEFGKYVASNMTEIIHSTTELAKKAVPNSHYFLITTAISITPYETDVEQGKKPFATFRMVDASSGLTCDRNLFMSVKTNDSGEGRELGFALEPAVSCVVNPPLE